MVQMTDALAVLEPPAPVAVNVTVRVVLAVNVCEVVTPVPLVPSPKFHEYDVAFVVALALKVQVKPEQLLVKLATGGAGAFDTVTVDVFELVPFASATVKVTE